MRSYTGVFLISASLVACGGGNEDPAIENAIAAAKVPNTTVESRCEDGGSYCPEPFVCFPSKQDQRVCLLPEVEGLLMLKDATLGGACISNTVTTDQYPGSTVSWLEVYRLDGSSKGRGRMVWEQPGFAVAAERGSPPDGTEFDGDFCQQGFNLGCDGIALFEIIDANGMVQKLHETDQFIVQTRHQDICGEEVVDGLQAMVCKDPQVARTGDLASCTSKARISQIDGDQYRGEIPYLPQPK